MIENLTPKAIVAALDEHIVGQADAKRAVAVALTALGSGTFEVRLAAAVDARSHGLRRPDVPLECHSHRRAKLSDLRKKKGKRNVKNVCSACCWMCATKLNIDNSNIIWLA